MLGVCDVLNLNTQPLYEIYTTAQLGDHVHKSIGHRNFEGSE